VESAHLGAPLEHESKQPAASEDDREFFRQDALSASKVELDALLSLASLIESKIAHEIQLTGHRMTWLMISQSFLLSALASLASKREGALWVLIWPMFPVVGISSCLLGLFAVGAAREVMGVLSERRAQIEDRLNSRYLAKCAAQPRLGALEERLPERLRWSGRLGALPGLLLPWLFIGAWAFLAYGIWTMGERPWGRLH
jgi:hypothetical protein